MGDNSEKFTLLMSLLRRIYGLKLERVREDGPGVNQSMNVEWAMFLREGIVM